MTSMRETNLVYKKGEHPVHGTWLSVDVIAIPEGTDPRVVLITRQGTPHRGETTLPGGLLAAWDGETVEGAARRIIREKVGVQTTSGVAVLNVVSDPLRDDRGHTVSIVVAVRVPEDTPGAVPLSEVPADMPFQHTEMLHAGLDKLRRLLLTDADITYPVLGDEVTMRDALPVFRLVEPGVKYKTAAQRLSRSELYRPTRTMIRYNESGHEYQMFERTN